MTFISDLHRKSAPESPEQLMEKHRLCESAEQGSCGVGSHAGCLVSAPGVSVHALSSVVNQGTAIQITVCEPCVLGVSHVLLGIAAGLYFLMLGRSSPYSQFPIGPSPQALLCMHCAGSSLAGRHCCRLPASHWDSLLGADGFISSPVRMLDDVLTSWQPVQLFPRADAPAIAGP